MSEQIPTADRLFARLQGRARRPRFAFATLLALAQLADETGQVIERRSDIADLVKNLIHTTSVPGRRAARAQRLRDLAEAAAAELDQLAGADAEQLAAFVHMAVRMGQGDPIGQNVSRALGDLERAGLIDQREYLDQRTGDIYPVPAQGRLVIIKLKPGIRQALAP
jgi:5-carboxymethyl-2-hydroxymuconate isomerase